MTDPPRDDYLPDLVSLAEAATLLGMTRMGAHKMVMRGELRGARVGTTWVFRRAAVEQLVKPKRTAKTSTEGGP